MSRNGAGTYSLPAGNPVVTGTVISSTWANTTLSDIATALTQSIAVDGQSPITANIPFNTFKATGLGAATLAGDAISYGQSSWSLAAGAITGNLALSGDLNVTGKAINTAQGSDIASASTINLDAATGNLVDVTGTTTITAVTLSQGRSRLVRFTGILTLTNGASLVLPGGANITTAAGDYALFEGYASSVVRVAFYTRGTGLPFIAPSAAQGSSLVLIQTQTAANVAQLDFVTGIDGTYNEYLAILTAVLPATNDAIMWLRFSEDGGSTFKAGATDYAYQINVLQAGTNNPSTATAGQIVVGANTSNTSSDGGENGEVRIFNVASTTQNKHTSTYLHHFRTGSGMILTTGNGRMVLDTNAINGFRFLFSSGNITSGTISLYGIKKA